MLWVDRFNAPSVALLSLRPKRVSLGKQPAGIERRNVDVDVMLSDQVENDLTLDAETRCQHYPPGDLLAKAGEAFSRSQVNE